MLHTEKLLSLAPLELTNLRHERFDGDGVSIRLQDLAPPDVDILRQLYEATEDVYRTWLREGQEHQAPTVREALRPLTLPTFAPWARSLGQATLQGANGQRARLSKVLHDLRGGALTGLVGYAQLLPRLPEDQQTGFLRAAVLLARDYAKIARSAVEDLDPEARSVDERIQEHAIEGFVEKWQGTRLAQGDRLVQVHGRTVFEGFVTSRCLETAAVDRILYNYINNAVRFAADDRVELTVLPIGEHLTRWVVTNRVTAEHGAWLQREVGSDLDALFLGGHTRGGQGIGLAACTDFITNAFGLIQPEAALAQGYLGARLEESTYFAWFHWPAYRPATGC